MLSAFENRVNTDHVDSIFLVGVGCYPTENTIDILVANRHSGSQELFLRHLVKVRYLVEY